MQLNFLIHSLISDLLIDCKNSLVLDVTYLITNYQASLLRERVETIDKIILIISGTSHERQNAIEENGITCFFHLFSFLNCLFWQ